MGLNGYGCLVRSVLYIKDSPGLCSEPYSVIPEYIFFPNTLLGNGVKTHGFICHVYPNEFSHLMLSCEIANCFQSFSTWVSNIPLS
jgi:hypothetical protein